MKTATKTVTAIGGTSPTNGGDQAVEFQVPYRVMVKIEGVAPIMFHRWNCEAVEGKANAKKGSAEKKTDNIESFLYRNDEGIICIPGEYLRGSIVHAAKYMQDPRSPRKSAMDLYKAGVVSLTELASTGHRDPDYIDKRRVVIQRNGITRCRPALLPGWTATFTLQVQLPEYIAPQDLNSMIQCAGRLIGLAELRPSFGRFNIVGFEVLDN